MKTIVKISSLVAFSMLLLLSVSCCSKSGSEQKDCCEKQCAKQCGEKESCAKQCCSSAGIEQKCPIDENTLMIVATLTVKNEADKADLENALHRVVDGTRTEEGNISYVLHQDINNPMTYIIFEVWKSQEAIEIHNQTPHFRAFVEAVGGKADLSVHTMKKAY